MELVKVVVLGAPQVGKSTLIKQFTQCEPSERVASGAREQSLERCTYFPSVLLNSRIFAFRLHDLPSVRDFPRGPEHEWCGLRALGLRSAAAYLLVFDLHAPETFGYVRAVRQQMLAARDMHRVPVVVVANKRDRVHERQTTRGARELQTVVRKLWKWQYVECSAKYNYRVVQVFRELTCALEALDQHRGAPLPPPSTMVSVSSTAVLDGVSSSKSNHPADPASPAPSSSCHACNIL